MDVMAHISGSPSSFYLELQDGSGQFLILNGTVSILSGEQSTFDWQTAKPAKAALSSL